MGGTNKLPKLRAQNSNSLNKMLQEDAKADILELANSLRQIIIDNGDLEELTPKERIDSYVKLMSIVAPRTSNLPTVKNAANMQDRASSISRVIETVTFVEDSK